ncbi:MAG: hypothetical protein VB108_11275 [Anaerolineaceae bacterium]|nr:hypothetical protein [Anaerolineaceae bacterium]
MFLAFFVCTRILGFKLVYERLKAAKMNLFRELQVNAYPMDEVIYREREFLVQDPDGYLLRFAMDAL